MYSFKESIENGCEQFENFENEKPKEPQGNIAFAGLKSFNRTRWCAIIELMKTHQKYAGMCQSL